MASKPRKLSDARADLLSQFPNLITSSWKITSHYDEQYNCFAWAAGDSTQRWEPDSDGDFYWPSEACREISIECFIEAFSTLGYTPCKTGNFEFGYQKVALYTEFVLGEEWPSHMARQDLLGRGWLSKLGDLEDIFHRNLSDLDGDRYGRATLFLRRSIAMAVIAKLKNIGRTHRRN